MKENLKLTNMYNFNSIGEHSFILKARWIELLSFNIVWSNDLKLPEVKFLGLPGYVNKYKAYTYRIDLTTIKIINKKMVLTDLAKYL